MSEKASEDSCTWKSQSLRKVEEYPHLRRWGRGERVDELEVKDFKRPWEREYGRTPEEQEHVRACWGQKGLSWRRLEVKYK